MAALGWVHAHATSQDVVLASAALANFVPGVAPCRVWVGHWAETPDFKELLPQVAAFYAPATPAAEKRRLLRASGCTLVVYGPEERLVQARTSPEAAPRDPAEDLPELRPVFQQGQVTLYRLEKT